MTIPEFKKTARALKETYKLLEQEAMESGVDIFSDEYKQAQAVVREAVLKKLGYTLEEYREAKELVAPAKKVDTKKLIEETQAQVKEIADRPIPEKVIEKTTIIEKPSITRQIINKITNQIIKEKPTIVKEQITNQTIEKYDDYQLRQELAKLESQIARIIIPPAPDLDKLKSEFNKDLQDNINILGMPDFRKLAMGLQGQIDEINADGGGGHTIQDEGSDLATRTKLNFVGAGVTVTDDAGNDQTDVTINGSTITGLDTQVLFFDGADTPAGDPGLTYNKTTNAVTIDNLIIDGANISTSDATTPSNITIATGDSTSGNNTGGNLTVTTGAGSGTGGGGEINFLSGTGGATGAGGDLNFSAGNSGDSSGGNLSFQGGEPTVGNNTGGGITFIAGPGLGSGTGGNIRFTAGPPDSGTKGKLFFKDGGSTVSAILDTETLATSDKTFTFPNLSGTFALTANNLSVFASTTSAQLAGVLSDETGTGLVVFNNSPTFVDDITIGGAGVATGTLKLSGTTSGTATITVPAIAGTPTYVLPAAVGASGTFLKDSAGDGVLSWAVPAGSGDVSKVGTPVNNQVGVWTGDGTLEGDAALTFDTTTDTLTTVLISATTVTAALVGNVTGDVSGSAATVTGAAQTAITSVGTLTALQVDNININGNTISSTAGTDLMITPLAGQQLILDGTIEIDAGVVTGATSITSTVFVGALTGNATTATTATVATTITVANEATDTTCFPLFVTAATGDLGPKTNASLTYNSNTGALTMGTTTKIQFTDTNAFINASSSGNLVVQGATLTTIGVAGNTQLGDGTLRIVGPNTNLKIDLGDSSHSFNTCYLGYIKTQAPTASTAPLLWVIGTAPTTPTDGEEWYDTTHNTDAIKLGSLVQYRSGVPFEGSSTKTVGNTTTETTLVPATSAGTATLPANFFKVGKIVRIVALGCYGSQAAPNTLNLKAKLGSTQIVATGAVAPVSSQTDSWWKVEVFLQCRTTGASGTIWGSGDYETDAAATTTKFTLPMFNTAAITVDTTASQAVDLTATWGGANASDTISCNMFYLEVIK